MKTTIDMFKKILAVICVITMMAGLTSPMTAYAVDQDTMQTEDISQEEDYIGEAVSSDNSIADTAEELYVGEENSTDYDSENGENIESDENLENIENDENLENVENSENIDSDENLENIENNESVENVENDENAEDEVNLESNENYENENSTEEDGEQEADYVEPEQTDNLSGTATGTDISEIDLSEQELLGVFEEENPSEESLVGESDDGIESVTIQAYEYTEDDNCEPVYTETERGDLSLQYAFIANVTTKSDQRWDERTFEWSIKKKGSETSGTNRTEDDEYLYWTFESSGVYTISCDVTYMHPDGDEYTGHAERDFVVQDLTYEFKNKTSEDRNTPNQVMYGDTVEFTLNAVADGELQYNLHVTYDDGESPANNVIAPISTEYPNVFEYTFEESEKTYVFIGQVEYSDGNISGQELVRITPKKYELSEITFSKYDSINGKILTPDADGITGILNMEENHAKYAVIAADIESLTAEEIAAILDGTYTEHETLEVSAEGEVTFPTDKAGTYYYTVCVVACDDPNVTTEELLATTLHIDYDVQIGVTVEILKDEDGNAPKISKFSDGGTDATIPDGYFVLRGLDRDLSQVNLDITGNFEYATSDIGTDISISRVSGETECPFTLTGDDAGNYYIVGYPDFSNETMKGDILPNKIGDSSEYVLDLTGNDSSVIATDGNLNTEFTLTELPDVTLKLGSDVKCSKNPDAGTFYLTPGEDDQLLDIVATDSGSAVTVSLCSYKEGADGSMVIGVPEYVFNEGENAVSDLYIVKNAVYYGPLKVKYMYDSVVPELSGDGVTAEVTNGSETQNFLDFLKGKLSGTTALGDSISIATDGSVIIKEGRAVTLSVDMYDEQSGVSDDAGLCMTTQNVTTLAELDGMTFSTTQTVENTAGTVSPNYYVYLRLRDNAGNTEYRYINAQFLFDEVAPELADQSGISFDSQKPLATASLKITESDSGLFKTELYLYDCVEDEDGNVTDAALCENGVYGEERKRRVWLSGSGADEYETDDGIETATDETSPGVYTESYELRNQYGSYLRLFVRLEDCAGNVSYYISNGTEFDKLEVADGVSINTDDERVEYIKNSSGKSFSVLYGKPSLTIYREGVSDAIVRTNETDSGKNDYIYNNSPCEITVKAENIPVDSLEVTLERTDKEGSSFGVFKSVEYDAENHCYSYKFCKDGSVLSQSSWNIASDGDYVLCAKVPDIEDGDGNVIESIAIAVDIVDKKNSADSGTSVIERVSKADNTYTDSFIIDTTCPTVQYALNTGEAANAFTETDGMSYYYGLQNGYGDPTPAELTITVNEKNWYTCDKPVVVIYKDGKDNASIIDIADAAYNGYITVSDWTEGEDSSKHVATVTINAKKDGEINHDIDGYYTVAVVNNEDTYYNYNITTDDGSGSSVGTGILEYVYVESASASRIDQTTKIHIDTVRPVAVYSIDTAGTEITGDNEYAYYNKNFSESLVITEKNFTKDGTDSTSFIAVQSYKKNDVTVSDDEATAKNPDVYEAQDDEREYVWNRNASGVYWIEVSGTDLAGNKIVYETDENNSYILDSDLDTIASVNQENNSDSASPFETKHKVLDKEAPSLSFTEAANTELVFNDDHTQASLKLSIYDKCFDLYTVEAVLFDGISQSEEEAADAIKYYDSLIVSGTRDDWSTYSIQSNPGYSAVEWNLNNHMGSYLRLFISVSDFAGNTQSYVYDFGKEVPFRVLGQPYSYQKSETEDIITAIKSAEPFALYGDPELDVRFTQTNDAISRAKKVQESGEETTVIDFIFTDRTGVSVTVKDIPDPDLYLKFEKEGTDESLLHIVSDEYITDKHCYAYGDTSTAQTGTDTDGNASNTYNFSKDIASDESGEGVYSFEAFVPVIPYNEIEVSIKSGSDDENLSDDKDVHAYSDENEVKLLNVASTEIDGKSGVLYSESFIKDTSVPVAGYSVHEGFDPFYINEGVGTATYYYGLSDGVSADDPMSAVIDITIKEKNWYEVDVPRVIVSKDADGDGNPDEEITRQDDEDTNNAYVKIKEWSKSALSSEYIWSTSVLIRPPKGGSDANAADGKYIISLINSDGTYYNYIRNDEGDKANVNDQNEYEFDYSDDSIQTMDSTVEIVIDTIRPTATYSVGTKGREFDDDDEYAYYNEDFTETLKVEEKNYKTYKVNDGDVLSSVSFMEVHSFDKTSVADANPSVPDDSSVTYVDAGNDVHNYSWDRSDEGIYWIYVSGTDLAGNKVVYGVDSADTNLDSDRELAESANEANEASGITPFETKHKVLDKSGPTILDSDSTSSDTANSGLTFNAKHTSATLDMFIHDAFTGLYSAEAVLFDGGGSKYGDESGQIEFYNNSKKSGSRTEWGADLTENPITSEFTWNITDTGSYLRLFIILEDYAGNVRCYRYDPAADVFESLDDEGFAGLDTSYCYSDETKDAIINAISTSETFVIYGNPELDVRFEQINSVISREKKAEDGSSEIDFIYTDRSGISVTIKDMPVSELALELKRKVEGEDDDVVIDVSSNGYDTANHCFKFKSTGTNVTSQSSGDDSEDKKTYSYSAEINVDGDYSFSTFVPKLLGEAEIAVSLTSGENAAEKEIESLTNEREIYASVVVGEEVNKVFLVKEESVQAGDDGAQVAGVRYTELFIKDTTVPVARYNTRDGYEPHRIIDKSYGKTYYYGLLEGYNESAPMTAIIDIFIAEENWYEVDEPQIILYKDEDGDGTAETEITRQSGSGSDTDKAYVKIMPWEKEKQDSGYVWKATVVIDPSKADSNAADGIYTISLVNSDGTYYNYVANDEDDPSNIDDTNELPYEYSEDSIQQMDSTLELVIDTIRPVATYTTSIKGREIEGDDEYAYYKEDFIETLSIKEKNFETLTGEDDSLIRDIEVDSYYKETVVDEDPGSPADSSDDHRVSGDDVYTYSWERTDEGVYWITVQGTDLAGNKIIYQTNDNALDADKTIIDEQNNKNGSGSLETRHKVLDKTMPAIIRSGDSYSGLFLNEDYSAAELDLFVKDKHAGLYSAEAVLFDGGGEKYGSSSGSIVYYDQIDKTGTREEWGADLTENPITSEFKWDITKTGSYLRLFIILEDFAGNTRCYKYDADSEKFIALDDDGFSGLEAPYRYTDETKAEIIAAISDASTFVIYGSPELDVRFEQTNDAISRAKQVTEDGETTTDIDFIYTDRSALSVSIKDMPVSELTLQLKKDDESVFMEVTSAGYDTVGHCFKYSASGTKAQTVSAGADEEKKLYEFSTTVDEDGVYDFSTFVPNLLGKAKIAVSITSGEDALSKDISALTDESTVCAELTDGQKVYLLNRKSVSSGVAGVKYTETFIKDTVVPVANCSIPKDYMPSYPSDVQGENVFYYGLEDGVDESNPKAARMEVAITEANWYDYDTPKFIIKKDGEDVTANEYISVSKWKTTQSGTKKVHTATVTINPKGASNHAADGVYTILLYNYEDGTYYNYIIGDGKTNINDVNEYEYEYADNGNTLTVDGTIKFVIDTIRPKAVYSVSSGDAKEYANDDYAYYKAGFTETLTVYDINISEDFVTAASGRKSRTDSSTSKTTTLKPSIDEAKTTYTYSCKRSSEGVYWITSEGTDKAQNRIEFTGGKNARNRDKNNASLASAAGSKTNYKFVSLPKVIDTTAPVVTYRITATADKCHYTKYDFYNKNIKVLFDLTEVNFRKGNMSFTGSFSKDSLTGPTAISGKADSYRYQAVVKADSNHEGHHTFTIKGTDKAGNAIVVTRGSGTTDNDPSKKTGSYTTGIKVMDITAPTYVVSEMTQPKTDENTDGTTAYYNTNVDMAFTVTDTNLDQDKIVTAVTYSAPDNYSVAEPSWKAMTIGKSTVSFNASKKYPLSASASKNGVYRFEIKGEDAAGNLLVQSQAEKKKTSYQATVKHGSGEFWTYNKVIDTIAPTGHINIGSYYSADLSLSGGLQVTKSAPYRTETSASGNISVTQDHSPVKIEYPLISSIGSLTQSGNVTGYSYLATQDFATDGQQVFRVDVTLTDRAGNTTNTISTNSIYLDVEAPAEDENAPTINIIAHANSSAHGPLDQPLFNGDVPFSIIVTDPNQPSDSGGTNGRSSGLDQVYYTLTVDDNVVLTESLREDGRMDPDQNEWNGNYNDPTLFYSINTIRTVASSLNSNNIILTVYATDHSGNKSQREYNFGIDIVNPTISVTYDNNDVQNERYFKADRTAIITVTERNFDPSKITITTNGGSQSDWEYVNNGGNGDNDVWIKRITYSDDGDFTFEVSGTDLLGNAAVDVSYDGAAPKDFTVDKTAPVLTLTFDLEKGYRDSLYFNQTRTATVKVVEHNFRSSDVNATYPGTIGRGTAGVAKAGGWGDSGDEHNLQITFDEDGDYIVTVEYTDLAGNVAEKVVSDKFTIDKTAPEIDYDHDTVEDGHAYSADIAPRIFFSDTNYNSDGVTFVLKGVKSSDGKSLELAPIVNSEDGFGGSINYNNFAATVANDDIYHAVGTIVDRAGNEKTVEFTFSVNRFGSTWDYNDDEKTESLVGWFTNEESDVYLREVNVNSVAEQTVDMIHDTDYKALIEGEDYTVTDVSKENGWKAYVYTFFAKNFTSEGKYTIVVHSVDSSGNENSNTNVKIQDGAEEVPLAFTVDKVPPYAELTDVDKNVKRYTAFSIKVNAVIEDNLSGVGKVEIYVYPDKASESDAAVKTPVVSYANEWQGDVYNDELDQILEANNGKIPFEIKGHRSPQTVRVVSYDNAGNVSSTLQEDGETFKGEIVWENVLVTTSIASQVFYNSAALGILLGAALLAGLIAYLAKKRKKKAEE